MKNKHPQRPIPNAKEPHLTAAWANVEKLNPVSQVRDPNDLLVKEAKDWVDSNEK